jgi:hypothetical protein
MLDIPLMPSIEDMLDIPLMPSIEDMLDIPLMPSIEDMLDIPLMPSIEDMPFILSIAFAEVTEIPKTALITHNKGVLVICLVMQKFS